MLPCFRLWLWISAFASLAGWGLSAAGELNRKGYAVAFAGFIAGLAILWFKSRGKHPTTNIQRSRPDRNHWMLDVQCWMFVVPKTKKISAPVPASAAVLFRRAGGPDFSGRGDSRAGQLHRAGVSRRARAAMAVARPLVLD